MKALLDITLKSVPSSKVLVLISFFFSAYSFGQNQVEEMQVQSLKTEVVDTVDILQKITQIDDHINAINIKINYINNDPTEKALAESTGWFDQMNQIKSDLEERKVLLQAKIK